MLLVFGTRPEAIKMAPVVRQIERHGDRLDCRLVVSAQHRQMLDTVLDLFGLVPHHDLDIMRPDQDLFDVTAKALTGLKLVLLEERPDLVLVQGDTTTAMVGALAAFYLRIPVGHIEAGLRTHGKWNPFPEEVNRHIVSVLADVNFAPTARARDNLLAEGTPGTIVVTGNTVIDALLDVASRPEPASDPILSTLDPERRLVLVTAHRRESFGEPMREMFTAMRDLARARPDIEIVYPVHMNPNVIRPARAILAGQERVRLVEPLPYDRFVHLMKRAHLILTDSGGIQEEAPSLAKPVLVMREATERPEGIEAGTVRLVGTRASSIRNGVLHLLTHPAEYRRMATARNPYGDGLAARRIVDWVLEAFDRSAGRGSSGSRGSRSAPDGSRRPSTGRTR